jgi:16S rRNA (cytidine1402-2'-O)-methyltransferase
MPKLYLIPCPLGPDSLETLPEMVGTKIRDLEVFIVERAKTARHFIKAMEPRLPISELAIFELDKHDSQAANQAFQAAVKTGKDIGVLSEAGCPGVADPGALVVKYAHQKGMKVIPLVGPSSILLALMASGLNGQNFAFRGYLPAKRPELANALKRLEITVKKQGQTQLFIEAPYRNRGVLEAAFQQLSPNTQFCIAADLTLPTEYIKTQTIKEWKKAELPDLHKRPAIFLIG